MRVRKLTVGPIVGWTTRTSIRLWGRGNIHTMGDIPFRAFGIAQLKAGNEIRTKVFKMKPEFDATGIADFEGLRAGKHYKYRVGYALAELEPSEMEAAAETGKLEWDEDIWIEARTAPAPTRNISFVFGTCRYLSRFLLADTRGDKTFKSVVKELDSTETDLLLMLGDQIYADDFSKYDPDEKLFEYWRKYRNAFSLKHVRKLMSRVPTYTILDDHEIRNNWTSDLLDKCETDTDHSNCRIFKSAMEAYHSYQLIQSPAFEPSASSTTVDTPQNIYYSFDCGRASFFALDTRTERSLANKMIISVSQMKLLKSWLSNAPAGPKFVATSVPVFPEPKKPSNDKWGAFIDQRDELLNFIVDQSISNVTFLSGDIHSSGCATLVREDKPNLKINQVISSPFWWPLSPGNSSYFRNGEIKQNSQKKFQVIGSKYFTDDDNYTRVTTSGNSLKVVCKGRKGKRLGSTTLPL